MSISLFILLSISEISEIANIIIAFFNLLFAGYIVFYQIRKDRKDKKDESIQQERNIKLQWFKELIISPNIPNIYHFYQNLEILVGAILVKDLSEQRRIEISDSIKKEASQFRKSFYDSLNVVNTTLHTNAKYNMDTLIDSIVNKIFDSNLNLNDQVLFDKEIGNLIINSKNGLIQLFYTYTGD